jgi:glutamate dehydrogenase (NADP+)
VALRKTKRDCGCFFVLSLSDFFSVQFLGFEQIFKNSLTTLPMGGGKGGSDFNPAGKSDNEVMSFCRSFMTELFRHIGPNTDVPAGDIGVGGREIGYLFGQYKRLSNAFEGVLTGKGPSWGGSLIRPEATGYGLVYFTKNCLEGAGDSLKGKRVAVSGSGNVAQYCVKKLLEFGAVPITMSDSGGYIVEPNGITEETLAQVMELKNVKRGRLTEYKSDAGKYVAGKRPWGEACDLALPCATQNEIEIADAEALVKGGCKGVFEGANMPSTPAAIDHLTKNGVTFGPAKAANAGGVAVSGLEMTQNATKLSWTSEKVDGKLQAIMKDIYESCTSAAKEYGMEGDLQAGANIAGFLKVADAMIAQGSV